jgi:hypothetical protein
MGLIWTMTGETVIGENRTNVAIESQRIFRPGTARWNGHQEYEQIGSQEA